MRPLQQSDDTTTPGPIWSEGQHLGRLCAQGGKAGSPLSQSALGHAPLPQVIQVAERLAAPVSNVLADHSLRPVGMVLVHRIPLLCPLLYAP